MTKMTYAIALNYVLTNCEMPDDVTERITALSEQIAKRADVIHKPTKAQKENEVLKGHIISEMEFGKEYTIKEMAESLPSCVGLSSNKVSALVKQLKDSGKVVRYERKRVAYFSKTDTNEVGE